MPVVHLVRHGQASFGGDDYDLLSDTGRQQATVLGAALPARCARLPLLVSGSLRRQVDTAEAARAAAGWAGPVARDARWNEYDHLDILRAHAGDPPPAFRDGVQQALEAALTGWIGAGAEGAGTESWPAFAARVRGALTGLLDTLGRGGAAVVFTSAGVIAAVCAELLALPADGYLALNRVQANASVTTVVHGRSGTSLLSFNDHAHLLGSPAPVTYR